MTRDDDWQRAVDLAESRYGKLDVLVNNAGIARGGSIVNVSSIAGILGRKLAPAVYSASKGAVRVFSKSTAIQHANDKIRCNSIHPGPIDTPMLAGITSNPAMLQERTDEAGWATQKTSPMGSSTSPRTSLRGSPA